MILNEAKNHRKSLISIAFLTIIWYNFNGLCNILSDYNALLDDETMSGKIGETFVTVTKVIDGYELINIEKTQKQVKKFI